MPQAPDYKAIAAELMFAPKGFSMKKHGICFRKGKTVDDINHALRKASKNGMGKTEFELGMFELYVKDVFKADRSAASA